METGQTPANVIKEIDKCDGEWDEQNDLENDEGNDKVIHQPIRLKCRHAVMTEDRIVPAQRPAAGLAKIMRLALHLDENNRVQS